MGGWVAAYSLRLGVGRLATGFARLGGAEAHPVALDFVDLGFVLQSFVGFGYCLHHSGSFSFCASICF